MAKRPVNTVRHTEGVKRDTTFPVQRGPIDYVPAVVLGFYLFCFLILKPWRLDFPLNDDWAYSFGVQHLLQEGRIRLCYCTAVTQVAQILWGWIWVKLLGWNLGVLKVATAVSAALGVLALDRTLRTLRIPSHVRLISALALAFNPIYFCWSFSFMTDVFYIFVMLVAFWFFVKAEAQNSAGWIVTGSVASAAAYLVRQTGALVPLGYFFHLAVERKLDTKKTAALWAIPVITVSAHWLWFHFVHGPTWGSENMTIRATLPFLSNPTSAISQLTSWTLGSALVAGLSIFPFAVGYLSVPKQFFRKKGPVELPWFTTIVLTIYFLACVIFLITAGWMPHLQNTLHRFGLGTLTLAGSTLKACGFFGWPGFWATVSVCSLISSLIGLEAIFGSWMTSTSIDKSALRIFWISSIMQFGMAIARDRFFDRYVLLLLPALILSCALCAARWQFRILPAWLGLLAIMSISFLGVMDYLAWNQAKWDVGRLGLQQGLSPNQIANGMDWDGYWTYETNIEYLKKMKPIRMIGDWDWQRLNPYRASTSFNGDVPGYRRIAQAPYHTPLSRQTQFVYLWTVK